MRIKVLLILSIGLWSITELSAQSTTEICGNGIDDDNDGFVDCQDEDLINTCCCLTPLTVDLGGDREVCEEDQIILDAGPGFNSYVWQDGSTDRILVVESGGTYAVTAIDTCDNISSDTIEVSLLESYYMDVPISFCEGDTITVNGLRYTQEGFFTQVLTAMNGCDSILLLDFSFVPVEVRTVEYTFCEGEQVRINGRAYKDEGVFVQEFETGTSCQGELIITINHNPICSSCAENPDMNRPAIRITKVSSDGYMVEDYSNDRTPVNKKISADQLKSFLKAYYTSDRIEFMMPGILTLKTGQSAGFEK